ncbi:MAG: hypothetical protein OIF54_01920, partial [Cohaesibacter sp.]|nr:hypothetical protein [Cohaesibacter sp.]
MSAYYKDVYNSWKQDPEGFWGEAAQAIDWFKPADKIFDADLDV